jgi:cation/acetate symporter
MIYKAAPLAIAIFLMIVGMVLGITWHFAKKAKTAEGYFSAGGKIHWSVNGIAFAGDYLSAASFLGICGMIATYGYDGFLYSIGFLAGWVIALFVVAEPLKRLGKYTFADAINARFNDRFVQLAAGISTLVISTFYLIPQMVGAGALVTPLLGLPSWTGIVMVGVIVTLIVTTAGMAAATYVQFLKGILLIVFSLAVVLLLLARGVTTSPDQGGTMPYHNFVTLNVQRAEGETLVLQDRSYTVGKSYKVSGTDLWFVKLYREGSESLWKMNEKTGQLEETQYIEKRADGTLLYNGAPKEAGKFYLVGSMSAIDGHADYSEGNLDFASFIEKIKNGTVVRWNKQVVKDGAESITVYYQVPTAGSDVLRPGLKYKLDSARGATATTKLDFVSLMLALFLGTAALPHILIRYYTVPSPSSARKSTIVAICAIGLFYVLTLYMGLGAMVSGTVDLTNDNMSAPLLAKSFGIVTFAIISAIAFATVLGTVSGLIVAASGAVAHDIMDRFLGIEMSDQNKVRYGKVASVFVGAAAIFLGIIFQSMNVSFLVGWAFALAASANLPAIVMTLFWKRTTGRGIVASIITGMASALVLMMLSPTAFTDIYHLQASAAIFPINNPAIVSVPLSFAALVAVSLVSGRREGQRLCQDENAA